MKIIKKIKRSRVLPNLILLFIWGFYFCLLFLNLFDILQIQWFWVLLPIWILPYIILGLVTVAILLLAFLLIKEGFNG